MLNYTVSSTELLDDQETMVVTVEMPPHPNPVAIHFHVSALQDRMEKYGLATREDAILALVKEQGTRINNLEPAGHTDPIIAAEGGGREDVAITGLPLLTTEIQSAIDVAAPERVAPEVFPAELLVEEVADG
jgi:hypothetical protein